MKFEVVDNNHRIWILAAGNPLGAIAVTGIRSYIFPFFTPKGKNVLQECPPDHPNHQGICVGQDLVNGHNFWAMGIAGYPLNVQKVQSSSHEIVDKGVCLNQAIQWITVDGQAILQEERVSRFEVWEDMHVVEVRSSWFATYGDLNIGQAKGGGVWMRVHYQLETFWGGRLRNSRGSEGEAGVFDKKADWIEVSGRIEGHDVGIAMMPHPGQEQKPWFTRDYGLQLFGPCRHAPRRINAGEQWELCVAFAAFDGPSDGSQSARAWELYNTYLARKRS